MRSDNLLLPCVQSLTSSYNLQHPHGHPVIMVMVVMMIMVVMVIMLVMVVVVNMVVRTGQD